MHFKGWRKYKLHFTWPNYCWTEGLSFVQNSSVLGESVKDIPIDLPILAFSSDLPLKGTGWTYKVTGVKH